MKKSLDLVMPYKEVRLKAMGIFVKDGKVLAYQGSDPYREPHNFYRLIGGTIEFGEKSEDAFRREIKEEIGSEVKNVKFLGVVENIFEYKQRLGHQIIFLYLADLVNEELYSKNEIQIIEVDYDAPKAEWVSLQDIVDNKIVLYPKFDYSIFLNQEIL